MANDDSTALNTKIIGELIRKARKNHKITIDALAEKADISSNYLGKIERGEDVPGIAVLVKIANALEISIDYILDENLKINKDRANKIDTLILGNLPNMTVSQKEALYSIFNNYFKGL